MIPPTGGGAKSKVKNPEMTEGIRATTWVCPYIEQRNGTGRMERRNIESFDGAQERYRTSTNTFGASKEF